LNETERVLVLAPHTDDAEFGCGGFICQLLERGCEVHQVAWVPALARSVQAEPPHDLFGNRATGEDGNECIHDIASQFSGDSPLLGQGVGKGEVGQILHGHIDTGRALKFRIHEIGQEHDGHKRSHSHRHPKTTSSMEGAQEA